jgi:hypothetical protein
VKRHIKTWKVHAVCKVGDMALSVPVKNKCNDSCHGKAIIIKYYECVWSVLSDVFCTILSPLASLVVPIFPHLINSMIFGKG